MRIDLHIHSNASDGSLPPEQVVAAAAARLDVIAITDHDTASGVAVAVAAAPQKLRVIPGIELSSTLGTTDLHILGYNIDAAHPRLEEYARSATARRSERVRSMIARLRELDVHVEYEDVLHAAGGPDQNLGRPHLAQAVVKKGYAQNVAEAFDRFLYDGGPAALPVELITPHEAIDLIHDIGGVAVWAHPPLEVLARELERFVSWGLDGIEVHRPRTTPDDRTTLLAAASRYELIVTGGSDWHGQWHGPLGDFAITEAEVQRFLHLVSTTL